MWLTGCACCGPAPPRSRSAGAAILETMQDAGSVKFGLDKVTTEAQARAMFEEMLEAEFALPNPSGNRADTRRTRYVPAAAPRLLALRQPRRHPSSAGASCTPRAGSFSAWSASAT